MSSSDDSDCIVKRRPASRKKVMIMKTKPTIIEPRKYEYSSDDSGSDSDGLDRSNADDDDDDANEPKMIQKQLPEDVAPLSSGFQLPSSSEEPKIFVLVGSCASGKSYMLKYMMKKFGEKRHFAFGICLTSTKFTGDYSYLPERSVRDFDMDYLEKYINHLRDKIEKGKKEHGPKWKLPHNFVIIDDSLGLVGGSSKNGQVGFFQNFVSTHRHTRTTIFLLSQLLTASRSVSTVVRANTSYGFLWPTNMLNAVNGLYENYGQMFTKKEFKAELDKCRERKYSCLVFSNNPHFKTAAEAYCRIVAPANVPDFELKF